MAAANIKKRRERERERERCEREERGMKVRWMRGGKMRPDIDTAT